jgi:predicted AAA+ superfamily ATPase
LTGPRQVGKTTLLLDLAGRFGKGAVYVAGDEPQAALPGFWERIWQEAETRAKRRRTCLLLDEIQHLPDWSGRLKSQWDRVRRRRTPIHVVASGSSSLRIGAGARESLAGRFERVTLAHWSASSLASVFRIAPLGAAREFVRLGSYPGAFEYRRNLPRWRAYVRDAIVEPAIGRDMLALGVVRRPALLRQVFAIAVDMPAQIVSLQKLQGRLQDRGALETIAHYLTLLEDAYLVAPLEKYSPRAHRRRAAPPKLVPLNNALISAMHPQGAPDPGREPERFGLWVENACLAAAWNAGQRVTYWREEPLEVDAVLDGSWGKWAVEIKTGRFKSTDLRGLLEFCRRHPEFRPLAVTGDDGLDAARVLGVAARTWQEFLLSGPGERS